MKSEAIRKLNKLIASGVRGHRSTSLLRPPDAPATDWAAHVPICFNEALDIRRTFRVGSPKAIWTQGANFAFGPGDTLYSSAQGMKPWGTALHEMEFCLQVTSATAVVPPTATIPRNAGKVSYTLFKPNEERTALERVHEGIATQDDFVFFLVAGYREETLFPL